MINKTSTVAIIAALTLACAGFLVFQSLKKNTKKTTESGGIKSEKIINE